MSNFTRILSLFRDRSGLSSIEFAMILPLMISLYFGAIEISNAMTIDRRVTTIASSVADIVAQATQVDDPDIVDIFEASSAIIEPYDSSTVQIVVSSVAEDSGVNKVQWSDGYNAGGRAVGSTFVLPTDMITPGSSVIVAEVTYVYNTPFDKILGSSITLTDTFFLRPRRVLQIPRV